MAKVCSVIVGLCCLFSCLIINCNSSETKSIGYETYHVTSNLEQLQQNSVNIRKKRQTSATQSSENASQQQLALPTELIKSNESQLSTETTPPSSKSDSSAWNRSATNSNKNDSNASVSLSKSTSEMVLEQRPLLGVNGTGQRKNMTRPYMVSDPISDTTSSSKISKPTKIFNVVNMSSPISNRFLNEENNTKTFINKTLRNKFAQLNATGISTIL